jgi:histidinol-phosphate aminotransferase
MSKQYRYSIYLKNYNSSIKLDINEYNFPHPSGFYNQLYLKMLNPKCITHYSNMYCDETLNLIKNIANINNLLDDNILLTSGSDTALEYIATDIFKQNTKLLYLVPNYSHMVDFIKKNKGIVVPIQFDILKDKYQLSLYLKLYENIIENAVIYISNPNNPTGLCVDKNDLILCISKYSKTIFVIDEAYIEFTGVSESMCELVKQFANIYIVRTFSKAYGIAGLRLGYILSQQTNILHLNNNVFNEASLTELSKCAGNYILENLPYYNKIISDTNNIKSFFFNFLNTNNIFYIPSHANFVSIYVGINVNDFTNYLLNKGFVIRNKTSDTNMYGFVRITIGTLQQIEGICAYILKYINDETSFEPFNIEMYKLKHL